MLNINLERAVCSLGVCVCKCVCKRCVCVDRISFANITSSLLLRPPVGLAHFHETYKSRFECAAAVLRVHNTHKLTIHDTHSLVTCLVRECMCVCMCLHSCIFEYERLQPAASRRTALYHKQNIHNTNTQRRETPKFAKLSTRPPTKSPPHPISQAQ